MARSRYWKLTADEVEKLTYDQNKVLNWEIKCIHEPEDAAKFIGIFLYRKGIPYNYESLKGIAYYHNNIERNDLPEITKFLKKKFGGSNMEKGDRIFLKESKEIFSGEEIAELAKELDAKFKTNSIITIEFQDITEEEQKKAGLPEAKLLPIPGK